MNKYAVRQSLQRAPLAVAVGSVLAGGSAHAATIEVNDSGDGPVANATTCTLRAAVVSANTGTAVGGCSSGSNEGDQITFADNLFGETITLTEGEIEISNTLSIIGSVPSEPASITVDGNQASRIFHIDDFPTEPSGFSVGLANMTLTNGRSSTGPTDGGAIRAVGADLTLTRTLITGNEVTSGGLIGGGGVSVQSGNLSVQYSTISDNVTSFGSGGGVSIVSGNGHFVRSTISDNRAVNALTGGGLSMDHSSIPGIGELVMIESTVSGNAIGEDATSSAGTGAGIFVERANVALIGSIISGNTAGGKGNFGSGAGVAIRHTTALEEAFLYMIDTTISDNHITGEYGTGGGMYLRGLTGIDIDRSTISGNSLSGDNSRGGGIYLQPGLGLKASNYLVNSTISGNSIVGDATAQYATADGGGMYVRGPANVSLHHATFAGNTATDGTDGIHQHTPDFADDATTVTLNNSVIAQSGAGGTACGQSGLEDSQFVATRSLATDASCTGEASDIAAIALGPLADNGGDTQTHALDANSVAINAAGDCVGDFGLNRDQRGEPRPGKGSTACDIGAYEFQGEAGDEIFRDRFEQP